MDKKNKRKEILFLKRATWDIFASSEERTAQMKRIREQKRKGNFFAKLILRKIPTERFTLIT